MHQRNIDDSSTAMDATGLAAKKSGNRKKTRTKKSSSHKSDGRLSSAKVVTFPTKSDATAESEQLFAEIPVLNDPVIFNSVEPAEFTNWNLKIIVAGLFGLFLIVFMISSGNDVKPGSNSYKGPEATELQIQDPLDTMHTIVNQITLNNNWSNEQLNTFLTYWASLEVKDKQALANKSWYLQFTFALQARAKQEIQSGSDNNKDIERQPLLKLAVMLGVMDQNGIRTSAAAKETKYLELLNDLKSEIVEADHSSTSNNIEQSESMLNEMFKKQLAGKTVNDMQQETVKPSVVITPVLKPDIEEIHKPAQDHLTLGKIQQSISAVEADQLVNEFVRYYETGNIEQFTSLFSPNARTNDQAGIDGIKNDYTELFSSTSHRLMNIFNVRWQNENNTAKGIGDMEVAVAVKDPGTVRTLHGKIEIAAEKVNGKMLITHLYHIERP